MKDLDDAASDMIVGIAITFVAAIVLATIGLTFAFG